MEFVVYLEQLQELQDISSFPALPSDPLSLSLASRLWNACIQLQLLLESTGSSPLLLDLCYIRCYCCTSLASHLLPQDMVRFWARTAKAYLDCNELQEAAGCLQKAEESSKSATEVSIECKFHLYKWSLELAVKRDGDIGNYVKLLCDLLPELPGERLGLCFFLYKNVAYPLSQRSLFAHAITALNACLALTAESPRRTEEVAVKARTLLCSLYLELQAYSKARDLLRLLPTNSATLSLHTKLLILTEAMGSFPDLIKDILQQGPACAQCVCDLLLSCSQLMDACRLLWEAAQHFQQSDLVVSWAKTLFCLVTMDPALSETAEYLSINAALEAVCASDDCEPVLPFLWNLCVERSHAGDFEGSTMVLRKVLASAQDSQMKHNALVLLAQNCFRLGRLEEALESLSHTSPQDGKTALLRLHILLRLKAASRDSIASTFASLRTTEDIIAAASEVLQEREHLQDWPDAQRLVCAQLTKVMQSEVTDSRLSQVVKLAVQSASDPALTLEYLHTCALCRGLTEEDRDWLHKKAWNLAIAQSPSLLTYNLLRTAGQLATTHEQQQRCLLAACHTCFIGGLNSKYQESLAILQSIQTEAGLLSMQREVEFEGLLVAAPETLAEHLEKATLSAENLKSAAGAAFKLRRPDIAALCLKQLLRVSQDDVAETAAVLRTLAILAASCDESFCYVEQAVKVAAERVYPREEVEWLLALCWNNGVKNYRLDKLVWAERWMSVAMRLVEKSESAHSEQMRKVYSEVLRQRYDS